jgi:hypothetical protein
MTSEVREQRETLSRALLVHVSHLFLIVHHSSKDVIHSDFVTNILSHDNLDIDPLILRDHK